MTEREVPATRTTEPRPASKQRSRFAAVFAGVLLDAVDLMTMGPIGLYGGFVFGAAAGWWAAREFGFEGRTRWLVAVLAAIYAATPATEFIPLGTLAGMLVRLGPRDPD